MKGEKNIVEITRKGIFEGYKAKGGVVVLVYILMLS